MSSTAFAVIYQTMWPASLRDTMYWHRAHLLQMFEIYTIAFACILMFAESGLDARTFAWCLRPHHQGSDFASLLCQAKKAFSIYRQPLTLAGFSAACGHSSSTASGAFRP
ncbi:unnamed protein product, partial [Prorocentrum cordatum]